MRIKPDYLVVGSGLFGSVVAQNLASQGKQVLVVEKRYHIGGNCFSELDAETGIEYHKYGTHIFHTSNETVWNYIQKFTQFNDYHHQVLTLHKNKIYQLPINLETINSFYNINLKPYEVENFLKKELSKENYINPKNLEEQAISLIGRPLYEAFIKNYTSKQWGKGPTELPASIIRRLPIRYNYSETYFNHARWQGIPLHGFTSLFDKLLSSPNIEVKTNCDYFDLDENLKKLPTIYTGPIDRFFNFKLGHLEWRSIRLEKHVMNYSDFQGTSVINYADNDVTYTRVHEPLHLHPERNYQNKKTTVFYEYSESDQNSPYYPVRDEDNLKILAKYEELAKEQENVTFGGRLGTYAYYDMDLTILKALELVNYIHS